jgi:glycosyltransferase involved in cell wall biosynthesis
MNQPLFFSIVVPAHNEEKYIEKTLAHLYSLDYPKESYEVIVVENGSSDATAAVAQSAIDKSASKNVRLLSFSQKGVAFARNRGIEAGNSKADWVIFIDADTLVKKTCLAELNAFLAKPSSAKHSMGTGSLRPIPATLIARFYFLWQDGLHHLTKTAYGAFFIVRRSVVDTHHFDEQLSITEDGEICAAARATGTFFYLGTPLAETSTRRFDKEGWLWTLLYSAGIAFLPLEKRRTLTYKVIR